MIRYLGIVLILFYSCKNDGTEYARQAKFLADSFQLYGSTSLSEFLYFEEIDSNTFKSYDVENLAINYYKKKSSEYELFFTKKINSNKYLPFKLIVDSNILLGSEVDNNGRSFLLKFNQKMHLTDTVRLAGELNVLKQYYNLDNNITSPAFKYNGFLYAPIYHNDSRYIPDFFNEKVLGKFDFINDTIRCVSSLIDKPNETNNFPLAPTTYCQAKNEVVVIFPFVDSLFILNLDNEKVTRIAINNRDFSKPNTLNATQDFTQQENYKLDNFRYSAIFYNKNTSNFIIFYYKPITSNEPSKYNFREQKEHVLVLGSDYKIKYQLKLNEKYFNPANYFFISNKGLAMPIFTSKTSFENVRYNVFNF